MESWWTFKISESDFRVKTQWIVVIFISLKIFWNVDAENGLTLFICTSETQVMAKRRARNQTTSLTPDQKKSGNNPIYLVAKGVRRTVEKLSMKATTLL